MKMQTINNRNKPLLGATENGLVILVALNAFTFIILNFLKLVYAVSFDTVAIGDTNFNKQILHWFVLHADLNLLMHKPWTIFLYMITNYSIWTLLSNLLWLWAFGFILQDLAGNKKMIPVYLYGGFVGAIVFILSMNFIPTLSNNLSQNYFLIGGGTSVMAVAVATTTLAPNYKIFPLINGGIPLWVLMVIYAALQFGSLATGSVGFIFAYLFSAAVGFLYIQQLNRGRDLGNWMYKLANSINNLFNPEIKNIRENMAKDSHNSVVKTTHITQEKIDFILDKINNHGYNNLNAEEKEFLNRASKEDS
jgi:membrane associated rhomboid family serine protease